MLAVLRLGDALELAKNFSGNAVVRPDSHSFSCRFKGNKHTSLSLSSLLLISLASQKMLANRHANLWRLRLLLIPLTLATGAIFAATKDTETIVISAIVISFVSMASYIYSVCGNPRVPIKVRTVLFFSLAYAILFICLSDLLLMGEDDGDIPGVGLILGCRPGDGICLTWVSSEILGAITGFMMILEVIMTGRLGPLDHGLRKHGRRSTYQANNVVLVRPDQYLAQPQVHIPQPQQLPYPYQQQQQYSYLQHEVIQHHPLPQAPQAFVPSSSV